MAPEAPASATLTPEERHKLATLIQRKGLYGTSRAIQLATATTAKLHGGLPVQRTTITHARVQLAQIP